MLVFAFQQVHCYSCLKRILEMSAIIPIRIVEMSAVTPSSALRRDQILGIKALEQLASDSFICTTFARKQRNLNAGDLK